MLTQFLQGTYATKQDVLGIGFDLDIKPATTFDVACGVIDIDLCESAAQIPESGPVLRIQRVTPLGDQSKHVHGRQRVSLTSAIDTNLFIRSFNIKLWRMFQTETRVPVIG